ncbi:D-glycero-beta-D-manno-heptose-7-phosphate kinase [Geoalkalibacter halelectricus]|uniref:Bifunctional protein HldE n=1 Tax=Geoalkalibacter halelectricus TaxID=2847045 RepID=A0ABY5ZGB9_9BACT|nr:D-glycero-beta-D-manno-heptose-7-phosphate kinase [Geoalkalibacter halelectricus]MDO3379590.1 D-glycero-beta-D-manno-heptose-7-phosphate kinase [Geoalkalibacter halelectricus]UWZ78177.1 D-glycero-beta-D-manno-heptose-7-phosphate kinase [Geoalkalibacter halelectricus]
MDRIAIESFLARLRGLKALVVGDLMLDEYVWGRTERISPEAPVQVVDVVRQDLRLGGAGNVVNNLVALGCSIEVAGALGDDADGRSLRAMLEAAGIGIDGLVFAPGRTTSRKTRILASNQQMLRIDRESKDFIGADLETQLAERIRALADGCQVILVSDYLKGVLTEGLLREVFAIGRAAGIPVVVDPKGSDYRKYLGATLLTPNRKEAQTASGIAITDEASLCRAGRALRDTLRLEALVLTRSEEGMSLFLADGREVHLPTEAREVFDVSGAGDTVLALLGIGLGAGLSVELAAKVANLAAGIVVAKVGTSTVSPDEILDVAGRRHADTDLKIKGRDLLGRVLERERERGKRIVFTNGCFDLLHVGHVKYLQKARNLGDLLVLGLNSDASIRRLKGPKRPLIGEEERAHLMAALKCIDYVVIFDEDTPLELISALRPHILVKGGDYAPEGVVGKELVESHGGRVEIIPFVDGKSTTNVIERILERYRDE